MTGESSVVVLGETAKKVFGVSFGQRKEVKETWLEGVQESIQRKRLTEKKWDRQDV